MKNEENGLVFALQKVYFLLQKRFNDVV